ncbi:hypothetical protein D3C84_681500 [compost metagenome]
MAGNQLLGHRQLELALNRLQVHQLREQVPHDPVGSVFQRQGFDFVDPLMQAHAEFAEQGEGQAAVALQQAHVGAVAQAIELRGAHGLSRGHIVGGVHQHHRLGEGLSRADDFEHFLLPVRGQAVDLHRTGNHKVKRIGGLALAKQRLALVDAQQMAGPHQLIQLFFIQGLEQVMAAQNLVMDAVKHHENSS